MSDLGLSRRTLRLRAAFYVLLGGAVVTMLVLLTIDAQIALRQRALLIECTTAPADRVPPADPSPADCYLRGEARTAAAVSQIGDLSIVAAACGAAHPGDVPATRACVERAIERGRR